VEEQVEGNGSENEQLREEEVYLSTSPVSSTFLFPEIVLLVGLAGCKPTWVHINQPYVLSKHTCDVISSVRD